MPINKTPGYISSAFDTAREVLRSDFGTAASPQATAEEKSAASDALNGALAGVEAAVNRLSTVRCTDKLLREIHADWTSLVGSLNAAINALAAPAPEPADEPEPALTTEQRAELLAAWGAAKSELLAQIERGEVTENAFHDVESRWQELPERARTATREQQMGRLRHVWSELRAKADDPADASVERVDIQPEPEPEPAAPVIAVVEVEQAQSDPASVPAAIVEPEPAPAVVAEPAPKRRSKGPQVRTPEKIAGRCGYLLAALENIENGVESGKDELVAAIHKLSKRKLLESDKLGLNALATRYLDLTLEQVLAG